MPENDPRPNSEEGPGLEAAARGGKAASIPLKVALPITLALVAGAYTAGRAALFDREPRDRQSQAEKESLGRRLGLGSNQEERKAEDSTRARGMIANLGFQDEEIAQWLEVNASKLDDEILSIAFNQRGFYIYQVQSQRAAVAGAAADPQEVSRALEWFEKAMQRDPKHDLPVWNASCMQALLGNAEPAVALLERLEALVLPEDHRRYRERICRDNRLCPIARHPRFADYIRGKECSGPPRQCSTPP